jgi:hypothetical protein
LKVKSILLFSLLFTIPTAWADISIQNDQTYVSDDDTLHIVGEIRNELELPINQINVFVTLYSEEGVEVYSGITSPLVNRIMPNMNGPFDLMIAKIPKDFNGDYTINVEYKLSEPKNQVIDITSSELSRDNFGNVIITGTVTNNGDITANMVSVIATMYDQDGNVVTASKVQPQPDYLKVNDETFFLVSIIDDNQVDNIRDYTLIAESEEYAPVPEFSFGTMIVLASSITAYLLLSRYSSKIMPSIISATNLK